VKPWNHSRASAKRWGGVIEDYLPIHDFIDSTAAHHADMRHRAILHNTYGIFICERVFGHNITNSAGKEVSVRDIAMHHIIEDLGRIPAITDYLQGMPIYDWIGGTRKSRKKVSLFQ
jgi:hypothetical protein